MRVHLHPKAGERLARIPGMSGSDYEGERAAAAPALVNAGARP